MTKKTKCGFNTHPSGTPSGQDLLVMLGPTLRVDIGFDATYAGPPTIPVPGITDVHALVDSGATECCIDALLAAQLNLPIVDRRKVAGIGGEHEVNVYLAQVTVPSLTFTIYGAFSGVDLAAGGQPHKALIGRTFLQSFKMVYDGRTGDVTITDEP
jgi:hypothetical protein